MRLCGFFLVRPCESAIFLYSNKALSWFSEWFFDSETFPMDTRMEIRRQSCNGPARFECGDVIIFKGYPPVQGMCGYRCSVRGAIVENKVWQIYGYTFVYIYNYIYGLFEYLPGPFRRPTTKRLFVFKQTKMASLSAPRCHPSLPGSARLLLVATAKRRRGSYTCSRLNLCSSRMVVCILCCCWFCVQEYNFSRTCVPSPPLTIFSCASLGFFDIL